MRKTPAALLGLLEGVVTEKGPSFSQAKSQMKQTLFKQPKSPDDWARLIKAADMVKASAGVKG